MKLHRIMIVLVLCCLPLQMAWADDELVGYSHDELLALGEKMYREGILPSGEPMKALVMGDIPFDGRLFTCDDCHQRSGLGSEEGTIISWPTNGKELYIPRRRTGAFKLPETEEEKNNPRKQLPKYYQMEDVRPAYTDKSLARALRVGKDPANRWLDPIMPKYRLKQKNMAILIYYLKHLSGDLDPGVDGNTLHFATVISDEVPESRRNAMLDVLKAHIDAHNIGSRNEGRRKTSGPFYKTEKHRSYRKLKLHIWELKGHESSWRKQLDAYYEKQPVFALLGGITTGKWEKIHDFSEDNKVPCIFPITDLPKISSTDWYTLYFSRGKFQEGEAAAKYLHSQLEDDTKTRIVQIYRRNNRRSAALARGFSETWEKKSPEPPVQLVLEDGQSTINAKLDDIFDGSKTVVLMLWLDNSEKEAFTGLNRYLNKADRVIASSTLLNNDFSSLGDEIRGKLLLTYPRTLPDQNKASRFAVARWLEARKIPITQFDIQAKMYFIGWMLPGTIKQLRSEFYRDYFLEGYDMMTDQDYAIAVYPRLTFGSGQRYASKGCYMVKISTGPNPEVIPLTDWVIF